MHTQTSHISLILNWRTRHLNQDQLQLLHPTHTLLVRLPWFSCKVFYFLQLAIPKSSGQEAASLQSHWLLCRWQPARLRAAAWGSWESGVQDDGDWCMCVEGICTRLRWRRSGWLVELRARSEDVKVQRAGQQVLCSHFFRGRGQLDDFIFGGLADDVLFFQK